MNCETDLYELIVDWRGQGVYTNAMKVNGDIGRIYSSDEPTKLSCMIYHAN